jgi:hypothetical protein
MVLLGQRKSPKMDSKSSWRVQAECLEKVPQENLHFPVAQAIAFKTGIYFADLSSKSNQYTFEGCNTKCKQHDTVSCVDCVRSMLVCRVALGKEYIANGAMNGITEPPEDYHCVIGEPGVTTGLKYKEFIIYNNHQVFFSNLLLSENK